MSHATALNAFLWIAALGIVVLVAFLVRLLVRIGRTAIEVEQLVSTVRQDLMPRLERTLDQAEAQMAEIRAVTATINRFTADLDRIAVTAGEFTSEAKAILVPVLDQVAEIGRLLQRGTAVLAGVRAGVAALRRRRPRMIEEDDTRYLFH